MGQEIAKLVECWRIRAVNCGAGVLARKHIEGCADELEDLLATAPPEQAKEVRLENGGNCIGMVATGPQPQAASAGALDDLISRCDELRLNRRRYGNLKWEAETGHLLARCAEAMRALAAHDQKVREPYDRLVKAAIAFADAGTRLGLNSLTAMPPAIIHEVYDSVRALALPAKEKAKL